MSSRGPFQTGETPNGLPSASVSLEMDMDTVGISRRRANRSGQRRGQAVVRSKSPTAAVKLTSATAGPAAVKR